MYGACQRGGVEANLVEIQWLPKITAQRLKVTRINGVAGKLAAVSAALEALPSSFRHYLESPASTFNCRAVAGTRRVSAHGYGIAIDIAVPFADYWRWPLPAAGALPVWRNRIPHEIVDIFERHGFIWGGRWHHFDTMHFEYRPEMIAPPPPETANQAPGNRERAPRQAAEPGCCGERAPPLTRSVSAPCRGAAHLLYRPLPAGPPGALPDP
jgi:hypothetical protein